MFAFDLEYVCEIKVKFVLDFKNHKSTFGLIRM